ncbi:MAG: von Willebrand factor type A domain-containing protein, partial [Rhodanobacter sp.]
MKLKALLRSLLLALLVFITGCSVPRSESDTAPPKIRQENTPVATQPAVDPGSAESPDAAHDKRTTKTDGLQDVPTPPALNEVATVAPPAPAQMVVGGIGRPQMKSMPYMPAPMLMQPVPGDINTENYTHRDTNPVHLVSEQPVSTFSIDVDTGSYTNVRSMLNAGRLPPADAVRAEEFINYFDYGYTAPAGREQPFSVTTELAPAPWNAKRQLLLVGIQGYRVPKAEIPASNLVFLIDTSGSMDESDKLPLLKASLKQLVRELRAQDRVAIVTYAGYAGVTLPSTAGNQHATIDAAIDRLGAAGSTNGGAGIDMAY